MDDTVVIDDDGGDDDEETEEPKLYNVGVDGAILGTGALSQRIFEGLTSRSITQNANSDDWGNDNNDEDNSGAAAAAAQQLRAVKTLAMQFSAQQALSAVLKQAGLDLYAPSEKKNDINDDDSTPWGNVESIRILGNDEDDDDRRGAAVGPDVTYDSWESAVNDSHWWPGQGFSFVLKDVPALRTKVSLEELLASIDPDGTMRQQQQQQQQQGIPPADRNSDNGVDAPGGATLVAALAAVNARRAEWCAPRAAVNAAAAYAGTDAAGYRVVAASDLRLVVPADPAAAADPATVAASSSTSTTRTATTRRVMNGLVSHGCLVMDLTNGGTDFSQAQILSRLWQTAAFFFNDHVDTSIDFVIPGLRTADGAQSTHAKVGYASYDGGSMQFLETRQRRSDAVLLPVETQVVLGSDGCQSLLSAFRIIADLCKSVVCIVVAASTEEAGLLEGDQAMAAATKLADELLDDGLPLPASSGDIDRSSEGTVSMSPHRLCRYSLCNESPQTNNTAASLPSTAAREVFGAHTDSTFLTAVPVAAVAGLEVYDEEAEQWYRPEMAARRHWCAAHGNTTTTATGGVELPWHACYVVLLPGELLQLASRDEVVATVHRVVAATGTTRLSAPILLRGRPGTRLDCGRYLGGVGQSSLLAQCDGMTMQDLHNALQVRPTTKSSPR